jgi:hypothetical protein
MRILEVSTRQLFHVEILPVEKSDYRKISKKRYFFDWKKESVYEVYKLQIVGKDDILGLVSVERIPEELRVHIRLLTVSKENKGSKKQYENITGNLLTFISQIALKEYKGFACVSLKPKGVIAQHYIDKYDMNITGASLSMELGEILNLIKTYYNE